MDNDIERVMGGQCIHGYENQQDCLTCGLTRFLGISIRRIVEAMFNGRK